MSSKLAVDGEGPVTDAFRDVATFVPKLIGFLLILVVGYVVAKLVAKVVDKLLERVGFDRAVERGGIKRALARSSYDASDVVAQLVFFAIFLPALSAAIGVLGIAALQQPMADFIALIPKILVGIVLVVIGTVVASAVRSFVAGALGGLSYGSFLAHAAAVLVLFGFVKAALDQVGIATVVTTAMLYTVLASVAGVVIVGVGGGLIRPMQSRWESILSKADADKDKIQAPTSPTSPTGPEAYPADPTDPTDPTGPAAPTDTATVPTVPTSAPDAPTATYGQPRL